MFVRSWKKNGKYYASVVKSVRKGGKVSQEIILYLGIVDENQIPYLKAAYASSKPKLVYKDGTTYEG